MAGLWELPGGAIDPEDEGKDRLHDILRIAIGLEIRGAQSIGHIEHLFTHRRLDLEVFRARAVKGERVRLAQFTAHRWVRPKTFLDLAHAGPTRKAMTLLGVTDESSARRAKREGR